MNLTGPLARSLTDPARAYIRRLPWAPLRRPLAREFLDPALVANPRRFTTTVRGGARIAGTTEDIIQRYLYEFGIWEPNLTAFIERRLTPRRTFIDVGANIGYFSLLAAGLVGPNGSVVAVEADPGVFAALTGNLEANAAVNVRPLHVAASDRHGTLQLFAGERGNCGATTTVPMPGVLPSADVEAAPLSELLRADEISGARMVKVDVEGAELAVVRGLEPVLDRMPDDVELVIELTPGPSEGSGDDGAVAVIDLLCAHGFHPYELENVYRPGAYATPGRPRDPKRLRRPLAERTDVVFSRIDAGEL
jgi:FkbM family methyltransferase